MSSSSVPASQTKILDESDFGDWDRFVQAHPLGLITHTSAWLRTLEKAFPHIRGRLIALIDTRTHAIKAGLPLYEVKSWLLGTRLVSVPFASISDPLVEHACDWGPLYTRALELKHATRAKSIEVRALRTNALGVAEPLYANINHKHHLLALARPEDAIQRSFAKSAIQNEFGRAQRAGVSIRMGSLSTDLTSFHQILTETRRRLRLPPLPLTFFQALWSELAPNHAKLYFAVKGGSYIASLLVTRFRDLCVAEYSGDLRIPDTAGVNQLLYWQAIKDSNVDGLKWFSFGRTAVENHALLQYKRRWGTVEEGIATFTDHPRTRNRSRESSALYKTTRAVIGHLPAPAFRHLGNFVYRHLG